MRPLLAVSLALAVLAATATSSSFPAAVRDPHQALLFALGLVGLGAGLSRPPES